MRSIVEERRQKTDQLLLTPPPSRGSCGKISGTGDGVRHPTGHCGDMPLVMRAYGSVSLARSHAALLAFFLMGAAAIAIGLFMSSLTENQIIAAVCTFGSLCFCI
ncbi:MAG: ABC transporter permease [Ruthenibacterium lactatiformans]